MDRHPSNRIGVDRPPRELVLGDLHRRLIGREEPILLARVGARPRGNLIGILRRPGEVLEAKVRGLAHEEHTWHRGRMRRLGAGEVWPLRRPPQLFGRRVDVGRVALVEDTRHPRGRRLPGPLRQDIRVDRVPALLLDRDRRLVDVAEEEGRLARMGR